MAKPSELAEAFQIFAEYSDDSYLLDADHDEITVWVDPKEVSEEHKERLEEIGFHKKPNGHFEPHFYYFT